MCYNVTMKKIIICLFLIFCMVVSNSTTAFADEEFDYVGGGFDWLYINNDQRKERVVEIFNLMFPKGYVTNFPKGFLKDKLKTYLKNKNHKVHYDAVCNGYTHYRDVDLQPITMGSSKVVYMYALQYTKYPQRTFYYDATGRLKFVDFRYGGYPEYPFYTKKYSIDGKLIRAMYLQNPNIMYIFGEKGTFVGVKYGNEIYGFNYNPAQQ